MCVTGRALPADRDVQCSVGLWRDIIRTGSVHDRLIIPCRPSEDSLLKLSLEPRAVHKRWHHSCAARNSTDLTWTARLRWISGWTWNGIRQSRLIVTSSWAESIIVYNDPRVYVCANCSLPPQGMINCHSMATLSLSRYVQHYTRYTVCTVRTLNNGEDAGHCGMMLASHCSHVANTPLRQSTSWACVHSISKSVQLNMTRTRNAVLV